MTHWHKDRQWFDQCLTNLPKHAINFRLVKKNAGLSSIRVGIKNRQNGPGGNNPFPAPFNFW